MDTDRAIAAGLLAVFAVGAVAVWRLRPQQATMPSTTVTEAPLETKSPERLYVENIFNPHTLSANPTARLNHELIPAHEVEAFLQAKGRTASTLIAAHAMGQDPAYLAELRTLQNDTLAQTYLALLPDAEAAKRLQELAPDNVYADFLYAPWQGQDDPPQEDVLRWLQETAAKTSYNSYRNELEHAIFEGFYFVSGDVHEAWRQTGVGTGIVLSPTVRELQGRRMIAQITTAIRGESNHEKRLALIQQSLRLAKLAMKDETILQGSDPGVLLESSVLTLLHPEEVEDLMGLSMEEIAEIHRETWEQQQAMRNRFQTAFDKASPAELDAVYDTYRNQGYEAARDLLINDSEDTDATPSQPVSLQNDEE